MKVGMTGRWPYRAWDFIRKANECDLSRERLGLTFDLEACQAWLVGRSKVEARRREDVIKEALSTWRVETPWKDGFTKYGAGGHNEWFDASQWIAAGALASSLGSTESSTSATHQTLAAALNTVAGLKPLVMM